MNMNPQTVAPFFKPSRHGSPSFLPSARQTPSPRSQLSIFSRSGPLNTSHSFKTKKYIGVGHKSERDKKVRTAASPLFNEAVGQDEGFGLFDTTFQTALREHFPHVEKPTMVQTATWQSLKTEGDVLIHSPTGTGKTLAYLLPALQNMKAYERCERHLKGLILVPNRELATQVLAVVNRLTDPSRFRALAVCGNQHVPLAMHLQDLAEAAPNLVVATPSRLWALSQLDHPQALNFAHLSTVVLDEADRLLRPLSRYPSPIERQKYFQNPKPAKKLISQILKIQPTVNLLFASATINHPLQKEARQFRGFSLPLVRYGEVFQVPRGVSHIFCQTTFLIADKVRALARYMDSVATSGQPVQTAMLFLKKNESPLEVIDCLTEHQIDHKLLTDHFLDPISHEQMTKELAQKKTPTILIANEDQGRGIDITVSDVFLFAVPAEPNDYLHLAGRTGRLNRRGRVVSFVTKGGLNKLSQNSAYLDLSLQEFI